MGLCELVRAAASLPPFQRNVRGHGEGEAQEEKRGGQGDVEERSLAEGDRCEKFSQATCDDFTPGLSGTAETGRQVRTVGQVYAVRCKHSLAVRRTKGY